jgi:toxin ParE1/3/4
MRYLLHPESEQDIRSAAEYYREQAGTALSRAFFSDFEHTVQLLMQHPLMGAPWRNGKRRFVMRHFPYSVIYTTVNEEIRVWAVAHHSRRPDFWRKRKWQL